jgi:hypothetical protein
MKRSRIGAAVGLVVAAGVAVVTPAPAHATTTRWRNADTTYGYMYLSVGGGPKCVYAGPQYPPELRVQCGFDQGTPLVVWPWVGSADQSWQMTGDHVENNVSLQPNAYWKEFISVSGWDEGSKVTVDSWGVPWRTLSAEVLGAPFKGCFVLVSNNSGYVMGVAGGVVKQGKPIVLWHLFLGYPGYENLWHKDQFWCPE